jgi:hypothetical protein
MFPQSDNNAIYVCVSEREGVGLFYVAREEEKEPGWIVAKIPRSWRQCRRSSDVPLGVDGCIEAPRSVLPEFQTKAEALRFFTG